MEQLLKQDPIAMGMLGKQPLRELAYRPITYILTEEEADKKIYYNLLTHEMIAVDNSELESPETRKYFIENWYLVPEKHDDKQLVDECRSVLTLMDSAPKKIHVFHIFTTLDCNARCFYCFEKRIPGFNMTRETASRAIDYMQEQADGTPIKIEWFGGEPLLNYSIIDYISCGLRKKGLYFESNMISNGLLFDNSLVAKAQKFWNLKNIQITLDGTRQVYKRVKAYETNFEDPFEIVLQNIKSLLRAGITVSIRLNIGPHNYSDIRKLVDFICEEFKGKDNLTVYANPLFEIKKYSDEKKVVMYEQLDELNSKLDLLFGKKKENEFGRKIRNSSCMASGREAVTILPDGKVGVCRDNPYGSLVGDIYTKELDVRMREDFGRRFYREDKCRPCPVYPNCYIVNGCPNKDDTEGCDAVGVLWWISKIKESMKIKCKQGLSGNEKGFNQK